MYNLRGRSKLVLGLLPAISTFVLWSILLISSLTHSRPSSKSSETGQPLHIHKHIQIARATCEGTLYPELCASTLQSLPDLTSKSLPDFISATLNHSMREIRASYSKINRIKYKRRKFADPLEKVALNDCLELFVYTMAELKIAISDLSTQKAASKYCPDLQTLLSGAMTNQYTCLDGFAYSKGNVKDKIQNSLFNVSRHVSNSLVMLKKIPRTRKHHGQSESKSQVVFPEYGDMKHGFPSWLSSKDRRLLHALVNSTKYDLIVAKDGTGNFTTISDAVAAAPNSSDTRFVIYIKAGAYFENVEVNRKKTKLMFVGDGIGKTVVKAGRNVADGWTTFRSATVAAVGDRFIAKGITFENAAGPSKHQAVAFRSSSDFSAFYKCSFVAYQDTLYVHSFRQFYRECDIYGTIDFIFGNAAVVFQKCNAYARKPNENQRNVFTAQGRDDPNQSTGISFLNCKLAAAADLIPVQSSFKTYLGRPWKEYSRTVIMGSDIGDLLDPAGWLEWNDTFALSTLYYGEYLNRGPGSNTSARVTWPGYKVINSSTEASLFTAGAFIQGNEWLNSTTVSFYLNLTG